jgi:hypothetical protein
VRTDEERLARWYRVALLAYPRAARASGRRAAVLLVCAVVASAAAEFLVLSPVGRHVFAWLLD